MYEENNNENKFTITLEGVLDRNATKSNLKKEFLSLKRENFFSQGFGGLGGKGGKDFLSLSLEKLESLKRPKSDNSKKSASFKSLNVLGKIDSFKDFLGPDFQKNNPKSVLKDLDLDLDLKDKIALPDGHLNKNKSSLSSYLKPEVDKLDLGSPQHSYFKTENIKNTFKQNFVNNSGEAQTNLPKDFRLNSNFNKTFPFGDLQEPLGIKNANSQIVWKNLMSFRDLFKDSSLVDFFNIKNGFNDLNLPLEEFKNLKDKKTALSLENLVFKDDQKESANKILKRKRSFETELERNDFLRKLYILQSSQNSNPDSNLNSNSNDFSFMVELAQKLKNEGHAKNDSKAISLVSDFLRSENNLEKVLSFQMPTMSLKSPGQPEVLNSKIIRTAFEPGLDSILEKTLELLEWAKNYDFTSSVLDPLRNTFSNLGSILAQAFESLPLVEHMTNLLNNASELNSRGIDDDSRMP
ncbi:hypothetical protein QIA19_00420 (plasmid) [Borreliella finlandensis]|uniref:hypothetical protein n=1 Tax=Borreliella finlandensis TaxID=498741 RepID=UPI00264A3556|nr:hypothetical protein [Borreliella finlandensis]WKC89527.1 hypothetical protein QIA19_00420 [Borreliella finlandensis]